MLVVINCRRCGKEKDKIEKDGTRRCSSCRREQVRERLDKKRIAKGLKPVWREGGRPPYCYTCGKIKENPNVGYCHECKRKQDNEWRLETGRTKRHRTGKCRCGSEFASFSSYQCLECYRKCRQDKKNDPTYLEHSLKASVRSITRNYIKLGVLIKEKCEFCGTNENIEAHHEDYSKPLDIKWFCRNHHREHHKNQRGN